MGLRLTKIEARLFVPRSRNSRSDRFLFMYIHQIIQRVPLAAEPGISVIILTPMKILQEYVRCVRNEKECVCSPLQISVQYPYSW